MNRLPKEAQGRALKDATRQLVHLLGGLEAAGDMIERGKSQVHRYTDHNDPADHFAPIDVVARLEMLAGKPLVTQLLCRVAGGVFVPLPHADGAGSALAGGVMALAKELGEVSAAVVEATADGEVTPREARRVERELDDMIERACALRAEVQAIARVGFGPVVALDTRTHGGGGN